MLSPSKEILFTRYTHSWTQTLQKFIWKSSQAPLTSYSRTVDTANHLRTATVLVTSRRPTQQALKPVTHTHDQTTLRALVQEALVKAHQRTRHSLKTNNKHDCMVL